MPLGASVRAAYRAITHGVTQSWLSPVLFKADLHYYGMGGLSMATLTVTARGQITFRKDVLKHLGIEPGGRIEVDLLPNGRAALKAARPAGTLDGFLGLLAGRTPKVATLEELNEAAVEQWAARK